MKTLKIVLSSKKHVYGSHYTADLKVATTSKRVHLRKSERLLGEVASAQDLHWSSVIRQSGNSARSVGLVWNISNPFEFLKHFCCILLLVHLKKLRKAGHYKRYFLYNQFCSLCLDIEHLKKSLGSVLTQWWLRSAFLTWVWLSDPSPIIGNACH